MRTESTQVNRKKKRPREKKQNRQYPVLIILVLAIFLSAHLLASRDSSIASSSHYSSENFFQLEPSSTGVDSLPVQPVYPYSVIPQGVHSREELRAALQRDSSAAAHYAGFQADLARVVQLAQPRQVYVSYRIGNQIYWTSEKVTLHAGETVLSDGAHMVRTRCGNRISELPASPVSPAEPVPAALAGPVIASHIAAMPEFLDAPIWEDASPGPFLAALNSVPGPSSSRPGGFWLPPLFWCCITSSNHTTTPGNPLPQPLFPSPIVPPVITSEPNSFFLLALGVMAIKLWLCFRSR